MAGKKYSTKVSQLRFGVMIEIPVGNGTPRVENNNIVDTVILHRDDWAVTKFGRLLSERNGDQFSLRGFNHKEGPLKQVYFSTEGEKAYWLYGFGKGLAVPQQGQKFRLLTPYEFPNGYQVSQGTVVEYCYSVITAETREQFHNVARIFRTTNTDKPIDLPYYAINQDQLLESL